MSRTLTDDHGRKWEYCDGDGSWSYGPHVIGCAANNGRRWSIWSGPHTGHWEYDRLREAIDDIPPDATQPV